MSKQSYPISRGIVTSLPNGGFRAVCGIFAEAKSLEQKAAINQELDDSIWLLSSILGVRKTVEEMQEALDAFCEPIEKDHGIICRGIVATCFVGLQYGSTGKIYKEGIRRE